MKIFITGGTGFIGVPLVNKFKENRDNLLILSRHNKSSGTLEGDLSNIDEWKKEVIKFQPDLVIHLAWQDIPVYDSKTSVMNLKYGLDLVTMLAESGCKKIISTGTCLEYGRQYGKLTEDMPIKPYNALSAAKNALHHLGREIAKENDMQFVWTRLFYVYGPGQKETSLIPYIISCAQKGKEPYLKTPFAKNDFVFVDDVVDALYCLSKKSNGSGVYNIGSGYSTSIKEIMGIIYETFGIKFKYKALDINKSEEQPPNSLVNFWADISKIKREIGWQPKTTIKEGISKTVEYFRKI